MWCVCVCVCVCAYVCVAHKKSKNAEFDFKLVIQGLVHKARGEVLYTRLCRHDVDRGGRITTNTQ